jgi:hypothetical protein
MVTGDNGYVPPKTGGIGQEDLLVELAYVRG